MKKRIFLVVTCLAVIFLITDSISHAKDVRGVTDKSIKIGLIVAMTGPAASLGVVGAEAIKNYVRYVNDTGGVNGRQLKLIIEDDRYAIPPAIAALKKVIYKDRIFALLGPSSASQLNILWKNIQKDKVPTIPVPMPEIAVVPFKKYIFTTIDTYPGQVKALVDYMIKDFKLQEPRVAVVYPDTEVGKIDLAPTVERLKRYNLEPVTREILNPDAIDASSQVMSMKRYKANCVAHVGTITPTTVTLLRELRKFGLHIPLFASWGAMLGEEMNSMGETAKQFYTVHANAPWYGEGDGVAKMRKITLKYHPGTEKPYRGTIYTHAWVMTTVMV
ncbi:MAG: ABC transporter substrate-binding protein, partial [Pseudomonadota bacterium]